jgi:cupin 2 domain-containing protein
MKHVGLNLLTVRPLAQDTETTETIVTGPGVRLQRIVSFGHASHEGFWYDQAEAEWVTLIAGQARIRIADQMDPISLHPGDTLLLPAHCRHRVDWTDPSQPTIWLALFFEAERKLE